MKHAFLDKYSSLDSPIHRLDPRSKVIGVLILLGGVAFTPTAAWGQYGLYLVGVSLLLALSRLPWGHVWGRALVVVPFVLLISISLPFIREGEPVWAFSLGSIRLGVTDAGIALFGTVLAKALLSILALILLTSSTPFPDLLKALERLGFPRLITLVISFMYRYLFVIEDEFMKMHQARAARSPGRSGRLDLRAMTGMVGVLFLRAYERAETVYLAMCSRGFNGRIETVQASRVTSADVIFLCGLAAGLIGIRALGA